LQPETLATPRFLQNGEETLHAPTESEAKLPLAHDPFNGVALLASEDGVPPEMPRRTPPHDGLHPPASVNIDPALLLPVGEARDRVNPANGSSTQHHLFKQGKRKIVLLQCDGCEKASMVDVPARAEPGVTLSFRCPGCQTDQLQVMPASPTVARKPKPPPGMGDGLPKVVRVGQFNNSPFASEPGKVLVM
jgi:hypothetical protein